MASQLSFSSSPSKSRPSGSKGFTNFLFGLELPDVILIVTVWGEDAALVVNWRVGTWAHKEFTHVFERERATGRENICVRMCQQLFSTCSC